MFVPYGVVHVLIQFMFLTVSCFFPPLLSSNGGRYRWSFFQLRSFNLEYLLISSSIFGYGLGLFIQPSQRSGWTCDLARVKSTVPFGPDGRRHVTINTGYQLAITIWRREVKSQWTGMGSPRRHRCRFEHRRERHLIIEGIRPWARFPRRRLLNHFLQWLMIMI